MNYAGVRRVNQAGYPPETRKTRLRHSKAGLDKIQYVEVCIEEWSEILNYRAGLTAQRQQGSRLLVHKVLFFIHTG